MARRLFTSESVTEGHPDKMADQISDAVLDSMIKDDPGSRVAVETMITTGQVHVAGEVTTQTYVDIPGIIRDKILEIGYDSSAKGYDGASCGVSVSIGSQSPDIAQGVNDAFEYREGEGTDELDRQGAGDQGLMFGYACRETPELMPLPIVYAHALAKRLAEARRDRTLPYLRPDGKVQVSVRYGEDGRPEKQIDNVVIAAQHHDEVSADELREGVQREVIAPVLGKLARADGFKAHVNPTGRFVIGGPSADVGLTGRKTQVDTYGGFSRSGGGCFSGKDPTKVDRAGAYGARHVAKNIVAAGLASKVEVQLAYGIGIVKPVAISIDTFGTGKVPGPDLVRAVERQFDLSPLGIIKELNLRRPLFRPTACYGHFGRTDIDAPWEDTGRAADLKAELGGPRR